MWSAFSVVLVLGVLVSGVPSRSCMGSPDLRADRRVTGAAALVGGSGIVLFGANLTTGIIDFHPDWLNNVTRDKTMLQILNDPAQDAEIVHTAWSPFAQVDVVETQRSLVQVYFLRWRRRQLHAALRWLVRQSSGLAADD